MNNFTHFRAVYLLTGWENSKTNNILSKFDSFGILQSNNCQIHCHNTTCICKCKNINKSKTIHNAHWKLISSNEIKNKGKLITRYGKDAETREYWKNGLSTIW